MVERVRAGMRRARLEGCHIGRRPLEIDRDAVLQSRQHGQSLGQIAKDFRISRTTVARVLKQAKTDVSKGVPQPLLQVAENRPPETAA